MIDAVARSYECHEGDPHCWNGIRDDGRQLLSARELRRYRKLIPEDEDLQRDWEAAVNDPAKYVQLMLGQQSDEEQREDSDEENYYPPFEAEQDKQNYYLAYHQVEAHLRYLATRPGEAEVYRKFQVSQCKSLIVSLIRSVSLNRVFRRFGTVSRLTRAMPRGILSVTGVMAVPLSLSGSCRMLMRVVAKTAVVTCSFVYWIEMGLPVPRGESTIVLGTKWGVV